MKILGLTLILYSFLFAPHGAYAANTSIIAAYPAASGSYTKVVLNTQPSTITCSASNNGLLFLNTTTHNLELCANGSATSVPYPETCFNRFMNTAGPYSCPAGYTQAAGIVDPFTTAAGITVYSYVCCSSSSTVLP